MSLGKLARSTNVPLAEMKLHTCTAACLRLLLILPGCQRCPSSALPCLSPAGTASRWDLGLAKASPGGSTAPGGVQWAQPPTRRTAEGFQGSGEMAQSVKALDDAQA